MRGGTGTRIDGVQRSISIEAATEKLARKAVPQAHADLIARWSSAIVPGDTSKAASGGRTFGQVIDAWMAHGTRPTGQPWSLRYTHEVEGEVRRRIRPTLGHLPLSDVTPDRLENAYARWRLDSGDNAAHKAAAMISSALTLAVRRGWVATNAANVAVAPAQPKSEAVAATGEQVAALLAAAPKVGLDTGKLVALGAITGARPGELAALRWRDVQMGEEVGHVNIRAAVTAPGRRSPVIKDTKTGTTRRVKVTGANLETLRQHLGQRGPADRYILGGGPDPLRPQVLTDRFTKLRKTAGIRPKAGVTLYSLRHAWATALLSAGVPVHTVAHLGGWKTPALVLSTYGHAVPADDDRAAAVALLPSAS